ncbi:MAG: Phosphoesterase, dhha1, partial [uncultured bacterium]
MKNYVLYHDDADGYASALAALLFFRDEAIYIPVQYNQEFPNQITLDNETNIYILDFSYSRDILDNIYSLVNKLVVIDHHDTAKDQFQDVVYFIFDNTKAGCILSWKYFHNDKKIPYIFDLVADRDLWKFYLSDTKAFDLGMRNTGKYS